jgi:hypothetical protein
MWEQLLAFIRRKNKNIKRDKKEEYKSWITKKEK